MAGAAETAQASGLSFIDHRVSEDTSGLWAVAKTPDFPAELTGLAVAGAVWEGGNTRLGKVLWQSLDADAMSAIAAQGLKYAFQRERPSQTSDPNEWFKGTKSQSFPSGDVATVSSLVTPLIMEYHGDHPSIYALTALPAFDMAARLRARAHWQTDVLAGAVIGVLSGYAARKFKEPFILSILPKGVAVGVRYRF